MGQGARLVSLACLPAATQSLARSSTPVLIVMVGGAALGEHPARAQWLGLALYLVGATTYLWPGEMPPRMRWGWPLGCWAWWPMPRRPSWGGASTATAMESSVINSAMTVEVPLLAWVFLGEALGWRQILGLALAGILVVQLGRRLC